MAVTIQVRRDTAANWVSANPVLHQGEPGLETDTGKTKIGDGSTAWNSLAYHDLPLAQLDARYANVFSPLAYGAKGNGSTDDTAAVQAAFSAAAAVSGLVDLGHYTFLTSSAIPYPAHVSVKGAGAQGGALVNTTSDLFTITGSVLSWSVRDCSLSASAGHVFNCASGSAVAQVNFENMTLTQGGNSYAIWYMPSGEYLDVHVGKNCFLYCAAGATISPWHIIGSGGTVASATFFRLRVSGANNPNVPFFHMEVPAAANYATDCTFRDITAELCPAGFITALSASSLTIENVAMWDVATYTSTIFNVAASPTGGTASRQIHIKNSGRRGGILGSGAYDVACAAGTADIILENVGGESGPGTYSLPANGAATVIGGTGGRGTVQTAAFEVPAGGGPNGVTSASRFCGSIVAGPPTASTAGSAVGASLAADFVIDQGGAIWVCTAPGTPGTWAQMAITGSFAATQDPLKLGLTQNYLNSVTPVAGCTIATILNGYYTRLLSGGYAISHLFINVTTSAGNISLAAYAGSGSGVSQAPGGGQLSTTGAVPCPALGAAQVALGSSITPGIGDWVALSGDTATTAVSGIVGVTGSMQSGQAYEQASRSDASCTTQSSTTVLDAAAVSGDLGKGIYCSGNIPAGATITAVQAGTGYTISAAATTSASGLTFITGAHPLPAAPSGLIATNVRFPYIKGS